MSDNPFSNNPQPRTPEQIAADVETALRQPWGLVPRFQEILSPEEYRRRYFNEEPPK